MNYLSDFMNGWTLIDLTLIIGFALSTLYYRNKAIKVLTIKTSTMKFQRKSIVSVKESAAMAFAMMGEMFYSVELCQNAKNQCGRPMLMDGSILRRLRELRSENPEKFGYVIIDNETGLYQKKPLTN